MKLWYIPALGRHEEVGISEKSDKKSEQPIRVLSASVDSGLNRSRAMLLEHHGFHVRTSESLELARDQISKDFFDVLVFGSTLPRDTCWQLAEVFRVRNPNGKIIEILPSAVGCSEKPAGCHDCQQR